MNILVQPLIPICSLFILLAQVVMLTRLVLQSPPEPTHAKHARKIQRRKTRGIVFSFMVLVLMIVYYTAAIYGFYRRYSVHRLPNIPLDSGGLKMLELWNESLQKSLLFYITTLIIPIVSSRRFRTLHIRENVSEVFVQWYASLRVFSYPLVFTIFGDRSSLGTYLVEVLSLSETCLLFSIYLLLLSKMSTLEEILTHTQLATRYEIEGVVREVKPGVVGLVLYFGLDVASRVVSIALIFCPDRGICLLASDMNSLVRIVLFMVMYHCVAKIVFLPARGVCESIQKIEGIKRHVAGTFLNLNSSETGGDKVVLTSVPNI